MRLLSFCKLGEELSAVGAMTSHGGVVDLISAYASYLYEAGESNPARVAKAQLQEDMIGFIVGGDSALQAAKRPFNTSKT